MPFQVYRASAGSGKTFTLVLEYLKLCLSSTDSMAFSKILAITFTNKAAGEMKTRIMESLETLRDPDNKPDDPLRKKLIEKTGLSEQELADRSAKVLRQMLHNYGLIGISTIDRFTLRVLKSFAHDLGLPAKFEVTMDRDALITNIVDMILEQVGHDQDLTDALLDLVESRSEDEKAWKIEELLEQTAKEIFNEDGRMRMAELAEVEWRQLGELRKKLSAYNKQYESTLKGLGKRGIELIQQHNIDTSSFSRGNSGIGNFLFKLSELNFSTPWPNGYVTTTINDDKWLSGKCPPDQAASIEAISGELAQLVLDAANYRDDNEPTFKLYKVVLASLHGLGLLSAMKKCLDIIQDETDTVSISEFNHLINDQVMDQPTPFIYERLGNRYQHFLIDEFQDTSVLQWFNLLPLIDESLSRAGFCMVVGDGKQSIYRFRGAKVEQFNNLPSIYVEPGSIKDEHSAFMLKQREANLKTNFKKDPLNDNWRSYPTIVNTNNELFQHLAETGQPSNEAVYSDVHQNVQKDEREGLVVFASIEGDKKEISDPNHLNQLGNWVQECIDDNFALGDMTILVRRHAEARMAAEYLLQKGVSVVSKEALAINGSSAVRLIVGLANLMQNPDDKINCAAIAKDHHDLKNIKTGLTEYLKPLASGPKQFISELILDPNGLSNLEEIQSKPTFQFFEHLFASICPELKDPRVTFFMDMVLDHTSKEHADLQSMLDLWEAKKNKAAIKMDDGIDAVKIMTIHQSKGLQFPVVFHPFVMGKPEPHKNTIWAGLDQEDLEPLSAVRTKADSKLEGTAIKPDLNLEKSREELDRLNTFYVALTRAEKRIYVGLSAKADKGSLATRTLSYLETKGWDPMVNNEIRFGSTWKEPKKEDGPSQDETLSIAGSRTGQMPQFRIRASKQKEAWNDMSNSRQRGQLIHAILEQLESKEDLTLLESDKRLASLSEQERKEILASVRSVAEHPKLQVWFENDVEVMNEQEILMTDGSILRPDRMGRKGDDLSVIEYKTGVQKPQHTSQLQDYLRAVEPLSKNKPQGFLVYTEETLVKPVSA